MANPVIKKLEDQMNSMCAIWFWNAPELRDHRRMLHHNDNNSHNSIEGARKKAMGVVAGVSDFELICNYGKVIFLEGKIPSGVQEPEQIEFMDKVQARGHLYLIYYSFEEFKQIIYGALGVSPPTR